MWSRTPCADPNSCTCRSWLTLSGPIDANCWWPRYQATVSREAPRNATPAPAYVILLVEANMTGRCGCPAAEDSERMSADFASTSVRWWKA